MSYPEAVVRREDTEWKVEIVQGARSISRLWIVDRRMRIGKAILRTAGVAGVGTVPEHRKRGLALRVLQRAHRLMDEAGYAGAFLFGIQDFYHRVGYATCMPEHGLVLQAAAARRAHSGLQTRRLRPTDLPAVRRLYEADNRERTAAVVRDRAWSGFRMGSGFNVPAAGRVVFSATAPERLLGYVLYDDVADRCRVAEVAGAGASVHGAILSYLARRAVALHQETISASVPADHPFAGTCSELGMRVDVVYHRNAGAMGRIIDLPRFAAAMLPEWEARWPCGGIDCLRLQTDVGGIGLRRDRDGVLSVTVGAASGRGILRIPDQGVLMQLAMGYRSVDDVAAAGQLRASRAVLETARELLPQRVAHMWWPDRF